MHLRYLEQANFDDRPHSVISYSDEDGLELSLHVDDKTGLVSKYEPLDTDSHAGDVLNETIFKGYRIENGRPVPSVRMTSRGGELTGDMKILDVVFNAALAETGPSPTK